MRFSAVFRYCNPTARFGVVIYPTVRFGAVYKYRECYGAVRCGFQVSGTLWCGSVVFEIIRCGSVRFSYFVKPAVWCGTVFKRQNPTARWVNRTEPHRTDDFSPCSGRTILLRIFELENCRS